MMQSLRSALVTTALLLAAACAGTSNTTTTSTGAAAMNSVCPMSGEKLEAGAPTTTWDGKTIGFCCNNCMKKFNAMSAGDQKAKVTGAMPMK